MSLPAWDEVARRGVRVRLCYYCQHKTHKQVMGSVPGHAHDTVDKRRGGSVCVRRGGLTVEWVCGRDATLARAQTLAAAMMSRPPVHGEAAAWQRCKCGGGDNQRSDNLIAYDEWLPR
jgi:hypothetical protein